ncbi:hypothetical protein OIO90_004900 [Microbotryomycetes sp. JL221]|nr:hypothetical protein OIO90_004900 [Microbotryomycetes sp. JL221]
MARTYSLIPRLEKRDADTDDSWVVLEDGYDGCLPEDTFAATDDNRRTRPITIKVMPPSRSSGFLDGWSQNLIELGKIIARYGTNITFGQKYSTEPEESNSS